jgi:hypothetical protein
MPPCAQPSKRAKYRVPSSEDEDEDETENQNPQLAVSSKEATKSKQSIILKGKKTFRPPFKTSSKVNTARISQVQAASREDRAREGEVANSLEMELPIAGPDGQTSIARFRHVTYRSSAPSQGANAAGDAHQTGDIQGRPKAGNYSKDVVAVLKYAWFDFKARISVQDPYPDGGMLHTWAAQSWARANEYVYPTLPPFEFEEGLRATVRHFWFQRSP